jgi:hypothetical protein
MEELITDFSEEYFSWKTQDCLSKQKIKEADKFLGNQVVVQFIKNGNTKQQIC